MTINPNNKLDKELNPSTAQLVTQLIAKSKKISLKKGEKIIHEGELADYLLFIENGCLRAYRSLNDKEITLGFSFAGDLDGCPYSFVYETPSLDTIEAITNSTVYKIKKFEIDLLSQANREIELFLRKLLVSYTEVVLSRIVEIKTDNAIQRYQALFERQPDEVSLIPLQYIASYLGITQERLSRIRKDFVKI